MWEDRLKLYDRLVATNPNFERKGKSMPYTSANGYMFSQLNKAGEIGVRLPKNLQKQFVETYNATEFKSYGTVMRDYVKVPESLLEDMATIAKYLEESYNYVMTLPAK